MRSASLSLRASGLGGGLGFDRGALLGERALLAFQLRLGGLLRRAQLVERKHPDQNLLLDLADLAGGRLDLVLHGVVLGVGLHLHQLLFVLAEPLLGGEQILVERLAMGLVVGDGLFGGGHRVDARP